MQFKFYQQLNEMDCGPTCVRMIARYYGKFYYAESIRETAGFSKRGVSLLGLSEAAEKIGFRTRGVWLAYETLVRDAQLPAILHWDQNHYVVLLSVNKWRRSDKLRIADPSKGTITLGKEEFKEHWVSSVSDEGKQMGTALLLAPTYRFYEEEGDKQKKFNWNMVLQYLRQRHWQIAQVILALLISSVLQLVFPFLTQSIVDIGINAHNLQYIAIVLIAQLMLLFSRTIVDFIRNRLLLRISIMVNLSVLSDFWIKLTGLPVSYFDNRHTGDTIQRIEDNKQLQNFLTGPALNTFFSLLTFVIFGVVLLLYNTTLFLIFITGSALYFLWVRFFLGIRRRINYQNFFIASRENNSTLQLVQGMQEIRLNNAEQLKRWEWENIQAGMFKLNFKNLSYNQVQQAVGLLINQGKDVAITFLAAKLVLEGKLSFGAMLAVQYIIGQLSAPVDQLIAFIQNAQDAKISMERLNEIHQLRDEEVKGTIYLQHLPDNKSIRLTNFSFSYPGEDADPVLKDIDLLIPEGKVTAIVGVSGSGKTTLLKILLKIYDRYKGELRVGDSNFKYFGPSFWRSQCGAVLQDGFIFDDPISRNIGVGDENPDHEKLIRCCRIANILPFIESLPNGFHTQLGADGTGISQGQRQRLLIARALYKDPHYLFLDEATNALDTNNERVISENLQQFFQGRTVVVVAHRLSTVRNADKIVVQHECRIAEEGTHRQLSAVRGRYFELVRNQLELGN